MPHGQMWNVAVSASERDDLLLVADRIYWQQAGIYQAEPHNKKMVCLVQIPERYSLRLGICPHRRRSPAMGQGHA